jgi:hypothetical protein
MAILAETEEESDKVVYFIEGLGHEIYIHQGVTKRCRLSWLTNSAYEPKCGGRGQLRGPNEYSCT